MSSRSSWFLYNPEMDLHHKHFYHVNYIPWNGFCSSPHYILQRLLISLFSGMRTTKLILYSFLDVCFSFILWVVGWGRLLQRPYDKHCFYYRWGEGVGCESKTCLSIAPSIFITIGFHSPFYDLNGHSLWISAQRNSVELINQQEREPNLYIQCNTHRQQEFTFSWKLDE